MFIGVLAILAAVVLAVAPIVAVMVIGRNGDTSCY